MIKCWSPDNGPKEIKSQIPNHMCLRRTDIPDENMRAQEQVEHLAAAQPKESVVIWPFDLSHSGIYLTVISRLCLWFKAVCTDPISFYTKEMQSLEMDCSVFTEAHRNVFLSTTYFSSSIILALHELLYLREFKVLKLVASWSAAWRVISPLKFSRQVCEWW